MRKEWSDAPGGIRNQVLQFRSSKLNLWTRYHSDQIGLSLSVEFKSLSPSTDYLRKKIHFKLNCFSTEMKILLFAEKLQLLRP